MLLLALTFVAAVPADKIVALPFGKDTASEALSSAVENALPVAARERGLTAIRADLVKPVLEALRACKDDGCRHKNARRLGARYAIVSAVEHDALVMHLVDVDVGDATATRRLEGTAQAMLADTPAAVDALVDQLAPRASFARTAALKRAHRARDAGDLDAADAAFAGAIEASRGSELVNLWLERARLFDAADRDRESAVWDALAGAVGPGTPGHAALDDADKARVRTALHDGLSGRASFDEHAGHYDVAARTQLRIAALFPDEAAPASLHAATLLQRAGQAKEARVILERVAGDERADDDVRLRAVAALRRDR